MKRIFALTVIIPALLFGLFSCATSPAPVPPRSSVWKISKDGNTLFLGGSVHVLRSQDFPPPAAFDQAFAQSAMLVLEADIVQIADPAMTEYLARQMMLGEDKTLQSILDEDVYEGLKTEIEKLGLPMDEFARLKPSMAINILTFVWIQQFGFVEQGIDAHYLAKANEAGKATGFLETLESQIDLLVHIGDGCENDYVRYSLEDLAETEAGITAIVAEWRAGDAALTTAELTDMKESWPLLYRSMIADRNAAWMPRLEEYLGTEPVEFVVVGLAHLHGPDGLLQTLANKGYTVEQLANGRE
jgi:uncharacterized protein YbaP (TraB family)